MSNSVLFDAPGPRAKRLSRILSIGFGALVIGGLGYLIYLLAREREIFNGTTQPGLFDSSRWDIFEDPALWGFIGQGVINTLTAAGIAAVLAIIFGVVMALLRTSNRVWIRIPTSALLELLRGMPVLLMMLFILLSFSTGALWAVVIALTLYNGAIIGEALRAGLTALPKGQDEAGLSLGMTRMQSMFLIQFPQAFRQMLPVIVAQLVVLLKDTSLGFIVGYPELLRSTMNNLSSFFGSRYTFSFFMVTLAIYLAMNISLSIFARYVAKKTSSVQS
ncbi:amino acid ABC transporter permease [Candidatus Aquiluna sp. UB-MaderosW2red]|jgi:glutamate transport system permease protein|uniref:amino acid ABC transporter permease n=1 Tax=Candidatus Aquiluna sp. UB-MaderosW2red TaxID=1855377 RepID=UPI000B07F9E2|nr:amino acid ABC transporter permease [Candidatus Aquiluna sp. UB-MaderosW2red]